MKRLLLFLMLPLILVACKDSNDENGIKLNLTGDKVYLWCGESRSIDILSENIFEVTSSDTDIIRVRLKGDKLVLSPLKTGDADVVCKPAEGEALVLHCQVCTLRGSWHEEISLTTDYGLESINADVVGDDVREYILANPYWDIPGLSGGAVCDFEDEGQLTIRPYQVYPYKDVTVSLGYSWDVTRHSLVLTEADGKQHEYQCEIIDLSDKGFRNFVLAIHRDATEAYNKTFPRHVKKVILTRYLVSSDFTW